MTRQDESLLTLPPLLTPVAIRCQHREYREGYVRGYTEAASALLNICELFFAGSTNLPSVRQRFAAKIEDAAVMLDEIEQANGSAS